MLSARAKNRNRGDEVSDVTFFFFLVLLARMYGTIVTEQSTGISFCNYSRTVSVGLINISVLLCTLLLFFLGGCYMGV